MEHFETKHDQERMRQQNCKLVLDVIRRSGMTSRADIAKAVSMSPTSVGRIVDDLLRIGLVREVGTTEARVGRKAHLLAPDPDSVLGVGVELEPHRMGAAIVRFDGSTAACMEEPWTPDSPQDAVDRIHRLVSRLLAEHAPLQPHVVGIGVALPGLIDADHGEVLLSAQLHWKNVPLRALLAGRFGSLPVSIDNEVKARVLADSLLHEAGIGRRVVRLHLGTGVGAALSIHNRVYRGASNHAGEVGHITIDPKGHLCACGRFGCLQTYIAEGALLEEARKFRPVGDIESLLDAYDQQESWARQIVDRAVAYVGTAVGTLVCLYNPDAVVVGGDLVAAHPRMAALVLARYREHIWEPLRETFDLRMDVENAARGLVAAGFLAFATVLGAYLMT